VLDVAPSGVVVRDAGSANGVWVDGQRVRRAELAVGQEFRIGASVCALAFSADSPRLDAAAGGPPEEPLTVTRTAPPSRRALLITMAVLPVLLGVGMAVVTGMWMFLAFTAVSAASVLLPLAEARSARRDVEGRLLAAADLDAARRRRASPDAGVLARLREPAAPGRVSRPDGRPAAKALPDTREALRSRSADAACVWLRLGTADVRASVVVEPPGIDVPMVHGAPVSVAARGRIGVSGAHREQLGLARSLLLQLALLPAFSGGRVLVVGGDPALRLAARFLPRTWLMPEGPAATAEALDAAGGRAGAGVVLLALGNALDKDVCSEVLRHATARNWAVIGPLGAFGAPPETEIRLTARNAALLVGEERLQFAPDLVQAAAFEAAARNAGACGADEGAGAVPERCGLDEMMAFDAETIRTAWAAMARGPGLPFALGVGADGPLEFDLVADGPHLLVAGTTGSGKSELLRSLVASAAASHGPDRLTFLFIDFKGGAGLEPLAGLPHCVGLVTDLDAGDMDRTLASLRAELTRREKVLAAARAADLADYARRTDEPLPRLVLVVDEFRMLVDEAPAALAELMRIATVGRSLGMHLVMATQRPQGALTADIRANVTSSIALRMQNDSESADVLGSPAAARIPVGLPGRAFLTIGSGPPTEFQTASLGLGSARASVGVIAADVWLSQCGSAQTRTPAQAPAEAAAPLVEAVVRAWAALGGAPVRRPVAAQLPRRASLPRQAGTDASPGGDAIRLGVVDMPHEQQTRELEWDPRLHGHLGLCGSASAGVASALASLAAQLAGSPTERHLYILDADGTLGFLRNHPNVGAYVDLGDLPRAARIVARLCEEATARLRDTSGGGVPLVLAVSAWGSWISALRQSRQAWAEDALGDVVRDGPGAGISLVTGGDRELVASRAFAGVPARLFFPSGSTEEARLGWPRLPAMPSLPGRAAAHGTLTGGIPRALQCYEASDPVDVSRGDGGPRGSRRRSRPFRVEELPAHVAAAAVAAGIAETAGHAAPGPGPGPGRDARVSLAVGVAGDDAAPLALVLRAGDVLLALGSPLSGKSSLLTALPSMNPSLDFVASPAGERTARWETLLAELSADPAGAVPPRRPPVVLVDDADSLGPVENQMLARVLEAGAVVVATAGYSASLYTRCPIALQARSAGTGILIAPRSPADGDAFGVRTEVPARVVPGRAIAVVDGRQAEVQLGFAGAVMPQPRSA
jgi:S-DNA-T family DNA segregation ATPase FtsK/SpoIIIE